MGGTLPTELKCARRLITLGLSGNAITGSLSQDLIDGLISLQTIDVSFNAMSGVLPDFAGSSEDSKLRYLYHA